MNKMIFSIRQFLLGIKYYKWNKRLSDKKNIFGRKEIFDKFENNITRYSSEEVVKLDFLDINFYKFNLEKHLPAEARLITSENYKIPQPFYMLIKNGSLIGNMAVAVHNENILIESTHNSLYYLNKTGDAKFLQRKNINIAPSECGKIISLVNLLSNNYYHWVIDLIPILEPIYSQLLKNRDFKVLIRKDAVAFQYDYLKLLGLEENIKVWSTTKNKFKSLIISSFRNVFILEKSFQTEIISLNSLRWIKETVNARLSKKPTTNYENIYISRKKSLGRNIVNEHEFDEIFAVYNVKKVFLEDLDLEAQIQLFKNAKRVIGPHGAGFSNIVFATHLSILEFFPKERKYFSSFHQIASHLDFKYTQIELPSINNNEDMKINIADLEKYLNLIY